MFRYYKESKFSSRVIAIALALLLGGLIAWRFQYDVPVTLSLILGAAFIAEAFFFHRRMLTTAILTLAQLLVLGTISLLVYSILGNYTSASWGLLIAVGLELVGLGAVIVSLVGSYYFAQGRLWFNALLCYIVYDTVLVLFIINTIDFSFVLAAMIALGAVLATILFRHFIPLHKKSDFDLSSIKSQKTAYAVKAKLAKAFPELTLQDKDSRFFFASNSKVIFSIIPLTPEKSFSIIKNEIMLDGKAITGILEYVLEETKAYSRENKINTKHFVPVIYVTTKSSLKSKLATIKVRARRTPEKLMGSVFIVTPDGFATLVKGYSKQKDIPAKALKQLTGISEEAEATD